MRLISALIAANAAFFSKMTKADETQNKNSAFDSIEINDQQCQIYSRGAAYALLKATDIANKFGAFGEYEEIIMMEDMTEEQKVKILQATACNNLCDKNAQEKHKYCKLLFLDLEIEEMGKVGIFQSVLKKKQSIVKPALQYAKIAAKKMLEKIGDESKEGGKVFSDEEMARADVEIKEFINKNMNLDKLGAGAQKLLKKFNINLDLESMLNNDPQKLIKAGMNIFNVAKEKYGQLKVNSQKGSGGKDSGSSDSASSFDLNSLSELIPEAKNILSKLISRDGTEKESQNGEDDDEDAIKWYGDDEDQDFEDEDYDGDDVDYNEEKEEANDDDFVEHEVKTEL